MYVLSVIIANDAVYISSNFIVTVHLYADMQEYTLFYPKNLAALAGWNLFTIVAVENSYLKTIFTSLVNF